MEQGDYFRFSDVYYMKVKLLITRVIIITLIHLQCAFSKLWKTSVLLITWSAESILFMVAFTSSSY